MPTTVSIGNVGFEDQVSMDDTQSALVDDGMPGDFTWGDYVIKNHYEKDGHRYMLPVTSPTGLNGTTVSFVQLGSPTLLWISDWTASRAGTKPYIPPPLANDPDWILLDEHLEPEMIVVVGDAQTPVYRISGTYVFGHTNPSANLNDNCNWARPPWLDNSYFDRTIPADLYQTNLIDQAPQQGNTTDLNYGVTTGNGDSGNNGFFGRVPSGD